MYSNTHRNFNDLSKSALLTVSYEFLDATYVMRTACAQLGFQWNLQERSKMGMTNLKKNNYIGDYTPLVLRKTVSNVAHSKYAQFTSKLNWHPSLHATPSRGGEDTNICLHCVNILATNFFSNFSIPCI